MTYQRRRLSWNSSLDNSVPLRRWGISASHDPFSVDRRRRFNLAPSAISFLLVSASIYEYSCCFHPYALDLHTQDLCTTQLRSVPPKSDPNRTSLDDLEVLYARSANSRGSGIPRPPRFTLWPRIYLRLAETSYPPKIAWKKASIRESSIGPIILTNPGTVLCSYFQ